MTAEPLTSEITTTDPVPMLQDMIRFASVNPPGGEGPCVRYVEDILRSAGVECVLTGVDPERPNLVARLRGRGAAPPLLMHAHVDVVPVEGQDWSHPPFDGELRDGHVWGRGAIDMKGGLAMMLSAILRFRTEGIEPPGDVVLAVSPDEEAGSAVGAAHLVAERAELFAGVRHAIGEDGGAVFTCGDRRTYPIVVAEKRACWQRVTLRGPGGHASRQGRSGTAMGRLATLLTAVHDRRMPAHITPAVDLLLAELAANSDEPLAGRFRALREDPAATVPFDLLSEPDAVFLDSILRNTVNATIVRTSDKINVLPSTITVDLDGRILPGDWTVADYQDELRGLIGDHEFEVLVEGERMPAPQLGSFYELLTDVLREADPAGLPLPMLMTASTDARLFASLGIACYGWLPLRVPPGARYQDTMHAADERVPVDALRFGADCVHRMVERYR
ncbi:M20/M25/M40 family metallo-hydrolase [Actinophytocola oryzae]|uniref:Acetylornithine deacetylase/succinyl-diaminopimelate desuccinylase-like protein n=1 Tax=Actinophytocola oryzae TaxID=502181 RepID=A0A4R7V5G7_9PSEU|nr:M20/M25/M40 family metallo-hydrolase [Actinophytocola oryzae]TDV43195.1 acetylornithine deacetylase/succinyl-diaminopimelate desuccinylase-like protein [Actinophytocola oryzae]